MEQLPQSAFKSSRWWMGIWHNPSATENPTKLAQYHTDKIGWVSGQKECSHIPNKNVDDAAVKTDNKPPKSLFEADLKNETERHEHYQFLVYLKRDQRLSYMKKIHP